MPDIATSKWWKEERHGVFLDYNQNAKDRTTCAAYSVRPRPDARVSAPLRWDEVATVDPASFTVLTMPARFVAIGDPHAGIDEVAGSLDGLLALASMRGRSSTWTRVRVNLRHVPETDRPPEEPPDPDEDLGPHRR